MYKCQKCEDEYDTEDEMKQHYKMQLGNEIIALKTVVDLKSNYRTWA